MSINTTFTGNIFDPSGVQYPNTEVKYQLYFYRTNASSSPSIWSSTRISEYGQYDINLGDSDIVTPEGVINIGDRVVIAFWTPSTSIRSDGDLVEWGFIDIPLTLDTEYIIDVQLMGPMTPHPDFSVTGATSINSDVYVNDIGCHDLHEWTYGSTTIYQAPSKYSQPLFFTMNTLPIDSIDISWGDTNWTYSQEPAQSYVHQYTNPNTYDITAYVTNTPGLSASQLFLYHIYYGEPVVDFSIDKPTPNPAVGITGMGEVVTFTNTSTDPDGHATIDGWTVDWLINDGAYTATYDGKPFDFSPTHQFHSAGIHEITMTLHWYDGFFWNETPITKTIDQQRWHVGNGLTWDTPVYIDVSTTFTPAITGATSYIQKVSYLIDGITLIDNLAYNTPFNHTFDFSDTHTILQTIYYYDGFALIPQEYTFNVLMSPIADFEVTDDTCGLKYTSVSEPGKQPIVLYKWYVLLNDVQVAYLEGATENIFRYNWPTTGNYKIRHDIIDGLGQTASETKDYRITSCRGGTTKRGGGGDGAYAKPRIVYKEKPLPTVRVKIKKTKERKINVVVKLINT